MKELVEKSERISDVCNRPLVPHRCNPDICIESLYPVLVISLLFTCTSNIECYNLCMHIYFQNSLCSRIILEARFSRDTCFEKVLYLMKEYLKCINEGAFSCQITIYLSVTRLFIVRNSVWSSTEK